MSSSSELHSPRHVARALGVSESSLKRWCDRGLIPTTRTAGGHRKVQTAAVIRFARERGMVLVTPELLGLPPAGALSELDLTNSSRLLAEALLEGNEALSRQIVLTLASSTHAVARVCDEVIARAFAEIGERWTCQQVEVYQERRGCEIIHKILAEIGQSQLLDPPGLTACGGTAAGDAYSLATQMAEVVLRDCGYQATSLGTSIPFASLTRAVEQLRPALFWLSASFIPDEAQFRQGFERLSEACRAARSVLVVGGRALAPTLREQLGEAHYCEDMQHLAQLARTLARVHQRSSADGMQSAEPRPPRAAARKPGRSMSQLTSAGRHSS